MGLKKSFLLLSLSCLAVAFLLLGAVIFLCRGIENYYPLGGYVKEDGKQISPDNRVRQYYAITPTGTDYLADLRGEYQELQLAVQQIVEGEKST